MRALTWQKPAIALLVTVVAIGLPFVATGFQSLLLSYALIFAIAILGLNILTGFTGQISLGHGAFIAIGAFVMAIAVQRYNVNALVTLPIAGAVCGAVGFLIAVPALRLEGIYLALATFALGVATPNVIKKASGLTGGVKGIVLPPVVSPVDSITDEQWFYFVCLAVAAILFLVAWNILAGRTGRAFRAIRDGEIAATAFGVNIASYKTLAFAISAGYAGVAGALYGAATGFVSADAFPFQLSIGLLVGAIIGGIGTLEGAVIGGLLTEFLPIYSQQLLFPISKQLANAAPQAVQGILLLLIMFLARDGIAGLMRTGYARMRLRLTAETSPVDTSEVPPAL
jgi:branched-chain amino acid transport system permease protein